MKKKLYLVSNSDAYQEMEFLSRLEAALSAGIDYLQLREKDRTDREVFALGKKVKSLCERYHTPLLLDDRLDVAMALGVGVHLGQEDLPLSEARRLLGSRSLLGATAKSVKAALQAQADGADYIGCGAIYPTATHVKTKITSVETFAAIKKACRIPVFAIGGLNETNLDILRDSGADGICVVRAIMNAPDVALATRNLRNAMENVLG